MTLDETLDEVAAADADLPDVVRILCSLAAILGLVGRVEERDQAVEVAADLLDGDRGHRQRDYKRAEDWGP